MKKRTVFYIILTILIILTIIFIVKPAKTLSSKSFDIKDRDTVGELKANDEIIQNFVSDGNYNRIGLSFANYGKPMVKGKIIILMKDNVTGKEKKYKIKTSSLLDNGVFYIKYKLKNNRSYTMKVDIKNVNYPITFYTTSSNIKDSSLYLNEEKQNSNIVLYFTYSKKNYFSIWYCVLLILITLLFMVGEKND